MKFGGVFELRRAAAGLGVGSRGCLELSLALLELQSVRSPVSYFHQLTASWLSVCPTLFSFSTALYWWLVLVWNLQPEV